MHEGHAEGPARFHMRRRDGEGPMMDGPRHVQRERVIVRRNGGRVIGAHRGINAYPHYRRFERGHFVPNYWWGPRFHVMNWGRYGLPQPMHGGRWVRYYDDALMIDPYGRIHDGRWGMSWDDHADQWSHDDRGIPAYAHDGYRDGRHYGRPGLHPYPQPYGHGQPPYAHPGYGYGGGMVVTETTVTTSPTVITETVYEDVIQSAPREAYRKRKAR